MDNKKITNHTGNEHVIEFTDDSIVIKDAKKSKKDNILTNDKEIDHKRKTDTIPNIEPSNRVKEEQSLILEHLDNDLEGDKKDVTESGNDNRKRLSNDTENEREIETKIQIDNKDRNRKCIERSKKGILRKPMANLPNIHKFQVISATNIIILSTLFGTVLAKNLEGIKKNELVKETSKWEPPSLKDKNYENTLISGFDCLDGSLPSTKISLNPPKQCNIEDGSAYERAERRRAQVLEHVKLIPVNITTCVVQFRVNVG